RPPAADPRLVGVPGGAPARLPRRRWARARRARAHVPRRARVPARERLEPGDDRRPRAARAPRAGVRGGARGGEPRRHARATDRRPLPLPRELGGALRRRGGALLRWLRARAPLPAAVRRLRA